MNLRDFRRVGHLPTLLSAFLYFDVSFMVWVILGALANSIVPDLGLNEAQRGLLLAVPLLGGSLLRLVLGLLADHIGARRTALVGLTLTVLPLLLGWLWADSYLKLLAVGLLLGVAGASFAVALPLASRWYPARYQGVAMGIAGAGNSGTALATLFFPILAQGWVIEVRGWHIEASGWPSVFCLALAPVLLTLLVFALVARDSPNQPAPKPLAAYAVVLGQRDTWFFCLFYAVTFGGFVGLAVFLNSFFHVQYGLDRVQAGTFATLCVVSGSFLRPVGGYLADHLGGVRMLTALYVGVGLTMLSMAALPPLALATVLLFTGMGLLGMGNGAVFQLVPLRFPKEIGVLTGVVGAAGGLGGFLLPTVLGALKQWTGSFGGGFLLFALAGLSCALVLVYVSRAWEGVFIGRGGVAATAEGPALEPEGTQA